MQADPERPFKTSAGEPDSSSKCGLAPAALEPLGLDVVAVPPRDTPSRLLATPLGSKILTTRRVTC